MLLHEIITIISTTFGELWLCYLYYNNISLCTHHWTSCCYRRRRRRLHRHYTAIRLRCKLTSTHKCAHDFYDCRVRSIEVIFFCFRLVRHTPQRFTWHFLCHSASLRSQLLWPDSICYIYCVCWWRCCCCSLSGTHMLFIWIYVRCLLPSCDWFTSFAAQLLIICFDFRIQIYSIQWDHSTTTHSTVIIPFNRNGEKKKRKISKNS